MVIKNWKFDSSYEALLCEGSCQKQTDLPDQTIYLFILIALSFEGIFFCD